MTIPRNSSVPFLVTLHLATPVALGPLALLPALDSLLAALITRREGRLAPLPGRDPDPVPLPLARLAPDSSCYAATQFFPAVVAGESPAAGVQEARERAAGPHQYSRAFLTPYWPGADILSLTNAPPSKVRDTQRGYFVTHVRNVRAFWIPRLVAFGVGDPQQVQDLLKSLTQIGGQRGIGYGIITRISVQRVTPPPFPRSADGALLRIIPLREAQMLGLDPENPTLRAMILSASVRFPLWFRPWWEPCLVPLPLDARYDTSDPEKEATHV